MADPYPLRLARSIKVRAGLAGITRPQLAEALGVNVGSVSRRMSGTQEWLPSDLEKIAPLFGVEPEVLAVPLA